MPRRRARSASCSAARRSTTFWTRRDATRRRTRFRTAATAIRSAAASYHYHSLSACTDAGSSATAHSKLVGYALDGFGIYGLRGERGKPLSNADLDPCHGHTHLITWHGKRVRMFHYHATLEYPYTLGCFRGTPVRTGAAG